MKSIPNIQTAQLRIYTSAWRHRQLIFQLARREITGRYRGSLLGIAWSFLSPLLMLTIYTTFFSIMLRARWHGAETDTHANYAIVLFVGLIVHALFAECINRAPSLITSNANYVKKIVFPLEILTLISASSALVHAGMSLLILLVAQIVLNGTIPWTIILFPLVLAPFVFVILGFAWFLSALGVYIRDIAQLTGMFSSVLLFMSPVFYSVSSLPESIQPWLALNPLTFIIEQSRNVLIYAKLPDWSGMALYYCVSLVISWLGFWWFQKTRKGFPDVI